MAILNILGKTRRKVAKKGEAPAQAPAYVEGEIAREVLHVDSLPVHSRATTTEAVQCADLIRRCPREIALTRLFDLGTTGTVQPAMRIVWALGRAAEAHVRNQMARAISHRMDSDGWGCTACHASGETYGVNCPTESCWGAHTVYREKLLLDPSLGISGHPDVLLIDGPRRSIVEIKSINKREYDALTEPKADHIIQASIYNRLLGPAASYFVVIFYVAKDFVFGSPYREFRVPVAPYEAQVTAFVESARAVTSATRETLPARLGCCPDPDAKTPQGCHACSICFQLPPS